MGWATCMNPKCELSYNGSTYWDRKPCPHCLSDGEKLPHPYTDKKWAFYLNNLEGEAYFAYEGWVNSKTEISLSVKLQLLGVAALYPKWFDPDSVAALRRAKSSSDLASVFQDFLVPLRTMLHWTVTLGTTPSERTT